ncbi:MULTISPECIES: hypothetical protein [unclassified Methanoculleus]|uniref:hypothetical protein n=1 Tax=unclassified Methanoculleus TaxID=2619537 RepID=UPI0025DD9BF0|nr:MULTISPECIES: hypothetical protein [unclassified Methanoculleus]MCK9317496.1 hypothetical protein [Methanoculleus sp.]MDD2252952.1 hypothetical protein [Methanoculleus sp.]MDD2787969.1 hypothetical protein [Methanoculleus sp.]MDD3215927.1 hypothetical protein [Methanoculleus sp.]MDD4313677.1 hypothetical protein [Methanoculleus sp.]
MDLTLPGLPKIAIDRRRALVAAGVAAAVIALAFIGWMLFLGYTDERQVAVFGARVAASEADLFLVSEKISAYMRASPDHLPLGEIDGRTREFVAVAEYGKGVSAYHRQAVAADAVPIAYAGAQSAYVRGLDSLVRAFSLWSSAAGAYDAKAYSAAKENLARADEAWGEYAAAMADYERELRAAEEGETVPPA